MMGKGMNLRQENRTLGYRGKSGTLLMLVLMFGCYVVFLFWPKHWESLKMKKLMKDAALTYQVTGSLDASKQKLLHGMKTEHISYDVGNQDCLFHKGGNQLSIECEWVAEIKVHLPGKELDFSREYYRYISVNQNGIIEER